MKKIKGLKTKIIIIKISFIKKVEKTEVKVFLFFFSTFILENNGGEIKRKFNPIIFTKSMIKINHLFDNQII